MVGLIHPANLDEWSSWQRSRSRTRSAWRKLKERLRPADHVPLRLFVRGTPRVVVALDSGSPSNRAALVAPIEHLQDVGVAVIAPFDAEAVLPGDGWREELWNEGALPEARVVLALGHFMGAGAEAYLLSVRKDLPVGVVQHGLLTPFAPPLPFRSTVLAWSEQDGEFWRSGRSDVRQEVVGSQLLYQAQVDGAAELVAERGRAWRDRAPVYLGQLHGAEMPKKDMALAAEAFCLSNNAEYRPHPGERDLISRTIHRYWQARGIGFDRSGIPLREYERPVVGVFSTGILEAAAAGIPAYVDFPKPPTWIKDFWARYQMREFREGVPTTPPSFGHHTPAQRVAEWVVRQLP